MTKKELPEIMGLVVDAVRAEWDSDDDKRPFYDYGHPIEIFNRLSAKDANETFKFDKYPLIVLFLDYPENNSRIQDVAQNITIAIIMETDRDFSSDNRFDTNFTPTLIPIYELFRKYIYRSIYLTSEDQYTHTKVNSPYYGTTGESGNIANIGNDALDAVIITDLTLKINQHC